MRRTAELDIALLVGVSCETQVPGDAVTRTHGGRVTGAAETSPACLRLHHRAAPAAPWEAVSVTDAPFVYKSLLTAVALIAPPPSIRKNGRW